MEKARRVVGRTRVVVVRRRDIVLAFFVLFFFWVWFVGLVCGGFFSVRRMEFWVYIYVFRRGCEVGVKQKQEVTS